LKQKLVVASNNKHKLEEIKFILANRFELVSMEDIGFTDEIEENGTTFVENAFIKARTIHQKFNCNCFADDSGLMIEALNNEPGVYSARYAGEPVNHDKNIEKVLEKMKGITNRNAKFVTVIALIIDNEESYFQGEVLGTIRTERSGDKGFGYDPIFQANGYKITFAEMEEKQKNAISHRARALAQMEMALSK
jgi:XTP/dITP diphosphohydrolase